MEDLGLSRKILAARLDLLVTAGVLERRPYSERPPRHDYIPTDKGADLFGVVAAMMAWGDRWTAGAAGPPALIRHTACGRPKRGRNCITCGRGSSERAFFGIHRETDLPEFRTIHDCSPLLLFAQRQLHLGGFPWTSAP
jgi:hypothetical protein